MEDKRSGGFQLLKLVDFDDDTYSPEEMISYLKELKYNYHYFVEGAKLGVDIWVVKHKITLREKRAAGLWLFFFFSGYKYGIAFV